MPLIKNSGVILSISSGKFNIHLIPKFQMYQLPCQEGIQNHETLSVATNNVNSRETHAENYLAQAENTFVNRKHFFKSRNRLVTCVVVLKQNYILQLN